MILQEERYSIPFFFEPNFETPMLMPTWDGDEDGGEDGGSKHNLERTFYTYGQHLLRKYKVRVRFL